MANNIGRYCEVIGHWIKGRVWKVIDERDGLLILSTSLGPGRMDTTFVARPEQVANLY
jgi:hypothetical protein